MLCNGRNMHCIHPCVTWRKTNCVNARACCGLAHTHALHLTMSHHFAISPYIILLVRAVGQHAHVMTPETCTLPCYSINHWLCFCNRHRVQWGYTPISFRQVRSCSAGGATYQVLIQSNSQGPASTAECRCANANAAGGSTSSSFKPVQVRCWLFVGFERILAYVQCIEKALHMSAVKWRSSKAGSAKLGRDGIMLPGLQAVGRV
jgi:hypothetical protein